MAKPNYPKAFASIRPDAPAPVEAQVTLMRKVGPERFEVVTGVVRGHFEQAKVLERSVGLMVGRLTARKSLAVQHRAASAALGLEVES